MKTAKERLHLRLTPQQPQLVRHLEPNVLVAVEVGDILVLAAGNELEVS